MDDDTKEQDVELIYSQADLNDVLKQLRDAKHEYELAHQMLWAVIEAAGGEVRVPHRLFIEGEVTRELAVADDPVNFVMILSTRG